MVDPAGLVGQVVVDGGQLVAVRVVQDQGIGVVELLVLLVQHAVTERDDLALAEGAKRDHAVTVNLGDDDSETGKRWHRPDGAKTDRHS